MAMLRAAVPVGGRTLTLLEMTFPERLQASSQARNPRCAAPMTHAAPAKLAPTTRVGGAGVRGVVHGEPRVRNAGIMTLSRDAAMSRM